MLPVNEPAGRDIAWPLRQIGKHTLPPRIPWVAWGIDLIVALLLIKAMTR